ASHRVRRPLRRLAVYWRRMPRWPIVASIPCTLINLISRTAILPLLALTLPNPPPLGPPILGSFGLLYSQLIIPTPAGLGAVDLGLLGGAAGELGPANTRVLLAWRFYTVGVGAIIGVGLALRIFGQAALKRLSILAFPEAGKENPDRTKQGVAPIAASTSDLCLVDMTTRIEKDPLGEKAVPADALYGIQTLRAAENFPISGLRPLPAFVDAVVWIKRSAALTHKETGRLEAKLADAIVQAADEILSGKHRDQFIVDVYQAGAGTSHTR